MANKEKDPKIVNRNNWFIIAIASLFALIIAYKIALSSTIFDLSKFDFSDLLNLLLAFFAIAMSVAFYYKATETSNQFYDNTYKFTKEMSEILGRIEAGFGERLKHLDEGYAGIRDKVERLPVDPIKAEKVIKKEEDEIKKREQERTELLESLATRANLEKTEKQQLFEKLQKKEHDLMSARNELEFLRNRLHRSENIQSREFNELPSSMIHYIDRTVVPLLGGIDSVMLLPVKGLQRRFSSVKEEFNKDFMRDLRKFHLLDEEGNLNVDGANRLQNAILRCGNRALQK